MLLGLLMVFLSSWTPSALLLRQIPGEKVQVVQMMRNDPSYPTQLAGCSQLRVDSSKKANQDQAAREGVIEAIAEAMNLFPEDKTLVVGCTYSLSSLMIFNRDNGLKAGKLGCLNHTLHIYMQNMGDPDVMGLGGAIGAYFDFVDENRLIARELGGIQAIIQNIKNNFHGQYSEWSYNPVKQSLFALSSGCWVNQDICFQEGFPELAVALMKEHGEEIKIAEETQQVTKALISKSEVYRQRLVDLGITDSMVHVLQVNPHDRGALDLTCENFAWLVGPHWLSGPPDVNLPRKGSFNKTIQSKALESGALEEVMNVVMSGQEMHHNEHGDFNFDVDLAYNLDADCFSALAHLGHENSKTQGAMLKAGLVDTVIAEIQKPDLVHLIAGGAGCSLLKEMDAVDHTVMLAPAPTKVCALWGGLSRLQR